MFEHLTLAELLVRWESELVAAGLVTEQPRAGISGEQVAATQARLGSVTLPPSYVDYLRLRDGMPVTGTHSKGLRKLADIGWFRELEREWYEIWRDIDAESSEVALMARALLVSTPGDQALLLDPGEIEPATGEWACYTFSNFAAGSSSIRPDFRAVLEYLYTGFLASHDVASQTHIESRDAVERAYQRLLAGDLAARDLLGERIWTNWRAHLLAAQFDVFDVPVPGANPHRHQAPINHLWFGPPGNTEARDRSLAEPVLMEELIPLFVVRAIEGGLSLDHEIRRAPAPIGERMRAHAQQIADGSGIVADFSYCPPFADAANRARALIACGESDNAWDAIRDALPTWTPRSRNHLTPVGLYYDKDLRTLLRPAPKPLPPTGREFPSGAEGFHIIRHSTRPEGEDVGTATVTRLHHNEQPDRERALAVLQTRYHPVPT